MLNKLIKLYNGSPLPIILNYPKFAQMNYIKKLGKLSKGKKVLDAGAGECPYKIYFKDSQYVSQDSCYDEIDYFDFKSVDIVSEIYKIPVADTEFDFVLCTEVLEHLKYPADALKEFYRILKPSGELWVSVPFSGAEHMAPFDYYRFTRYALKLLGEDAGFKIKEITPLGGRFSYFALVLKNLIPNMFESNPKIYTILSLVQLPLIIVPLTLCYFLDKTDKDKQLTPSFFAIYTKS